MENKGKDTNSKSRERVEVMEHIGWYGKLRRGHRVIVTCAFGRSRNFLETKCIDVLCIILSPERTRGAYKTSLPSGSLAPSWVSNK